MKKPLYAGSISFSRTAVNHGKALTRLRYTKVFAEDETRATASAWVTRSSSHVIGFSFAQWALALLQSKSVTPNSAANDALKKPELLHGMNAVEARALYETGQDGSPTRERSTPARSPLWRWPPTRAAAGAALSSSDASEKTGDIESGVDNSLLLLPTPRRETPQQARTRHPHERVPGGLGVTYARTTLLHAHHQAVRAFEGG